jgi:DNA-binding HxlR family transcriptional regulator
MKRTSFGKMQCPVARSLERIGEWWSILIIRDALHGLTRFDQFEDSLGIAPNMLTRRLAALVKAGVLEKHRYSERPPRYEYLLTARGRDFKQVILAMQAWGNKHFAPEGASVMLVHAATGEAADPLMVDRKTGLPLAGPEYVVAAGPAAGEGTRCKIAASTWGRAAEEDHPALPAASRKVLKPGARS